MLIRRGGAFPFLPPLLDMTRIQWRSSRARSLTSVRITAKLTPPCKVRVPFNHSLGDGPRSEL